MAISRRGPTRAVLIRQNCSQLIATFAGGGLPQLDSLINSFDSPQSLLGFSAIRTPSSYLNPFERQQAPLPLDTRLQTAWSVQSQPSGRWRNPGTHVCPIPIQSQASGNLKSALSMAPSVSQQPLPAQPQLTSFVIAQLNAAEFKKQNVRIANPVSCA